MGFMRSYKHLEKLCGEVLGDDRRISAYIDEMLNCPQGDYYVEGWSEDLKRLKHYRWVRNQIVHEPGCSEETMCNEADAYWLNDFYRRIMNQTDPLTLYFRVTKTHARSAIREPEAPMHSSPPKMHSNPRENASEPLSAGLLFLVFLATLFVYFVLMKL